MVNRSNRSGLKDKLLRFLPIYGAYKIEEELREWDRSIRDEATLHLTKAEDNLLPMLEGAVKNRNRETISQIEKSRKKIHNIKESIKTATYGYFPRSSPIQIKENTLKQSLDIDEEIVDMTKAISNKAEVLSHKYEGQEREVMMDLLELSANIKTTKDLLLKRKMLLRKGSLEEED